jgi:HPt (histidine-containing phosphotransfer) domain-containing protein
MDTQTASIQNSATSCQWKQCERNIVVCDADLDDIIPDYLEGKQEECVQLRELSHKGDFGEIRSIAHGMKGSGGCYGFSVISNIGAVMESAAKTGNMPDILAQLEILEAYLRCVEVHYE